MEFIFFTLGIIFGGAVTNILFYRNTEFGILRIDRHDPEKELYKIEINSFDILSRRKRVILKVDNDAKL